MSKRLKKNFHRLRFTVKGFHLRSFISKSLQRLPFSSEYFGPPKSHISVQKLSKTSTHSYREIFPKYTFEYPSFPLADAITGDGFKNSPAGKTYFPPVFLLTMKEGRVFGGNGVVITNNDLVVKETAIEWVKSINEHSIFQKWKLPRIVKKNECIAVVASKSSPCYFHWIFDILPRFEILRRANVSYDRIYLNPLRHPFQKETFKMMNIDPAKVIWSDPKIHLKAEQLVVPSLPAIPGTMSRWVCRFLQQKILPSNLRKKHAKIYISRREAFSRRIVNEEILLRFLKSQGFEEYTLENLSVAEQASLFASAKVIVSSHGAALTNLVFCQEGAHVVEIFTPNYVNPCYWLLSQQLKLRHHPVLGSNKNLSCAQRKKHDVFICLNELETIFQKLESI